MLKKLFFNFLKLNINHILFRAKYEGYENIKDLEKFVVCPNHSHSFDPFWVRFKIDDMWIMAKAELFKNKIMAALLKAYNVFPIKRGKKDASSLIHAINIIKENDNARLLVFPEGTRIKKGKDRGVAKVGPMFIASKAEVPVVPVHITKNPRLFSKVTVKFGKPIEVPKDLHENKEELKRYSDMLLDRIYELNNINDNNNDNK